MALSAKALQEMGIRESPEVVERMVLQAMRRILAGLPPTALKRFSVPSPDDTLDDGGLDLDYDEFKSWPPVVIALQYLFSYNGLWYCSSMNANQPCVALYARAEDSLPQSPLFHASLSHPSLRTALENTAHSFSYSLV